MEENKNYIEPEKKVDDSSEEEASIDWMEILRKIIAIRKTLYKAAGVGLVIGMIVAFSIPKEYTVTVTLSPEMGSDAKASGGLASLASTFLGGGAMSTGGADALNAALSSDIVTSTPFLLEMFNTRVQDIDGEIDTTLAAYLDMQKAPWWSYILKSPRMVIGGIKGLFVEERTDSIGGLNPFQLTEEETDKVLALKQSIFADIDKKTAITTISVTLQDPKVTAIVADSVVNKLQEYIIKYRVAKAKEDCTYLEHLYKERQAEYYNAQEKYAQYVDANKSVILQSARTEEERLQNDMSLAFQVYSQVAQQLELSKAKIQEAKPVFAIVEPASIPLIPSGNSRKKIILGIILASVAGVGLWKLYLYPSLEILNKKLKDKNQ